MLSLRPLNKDKLGRCVLQMWRKALHSSGKNNNLRTIDSIFQHWLELRTKISSQHKQKQLLNTYNKTPQYKQKITPIQTEDYLNTNRSSSQYKQKFISIKTEVHLNTNRSSSQYKQKSISIQTEVHLNTNRGQSQYKQKSILIQTEVHLNTNRSPSLEKQKQLLNTYNKTPQYKLKIISI